MIDYQDTGQFIKTHMGKFRNGRYARKLSDTVWQELERDTYLDNCVYAKGSKFKVWETSNFGWIAFHPDTKTADGHIPNKRLLRY